MQFPEAIERTPLKKRAKARLDWMLAHAGLMTIGTGSLRQVASHAGIDASTIYKSIGRGKFTYETAKRLEESFGKSLLKSEHLMEPMKITQ